MLFLLDHFRLSWLFYAVSFIRHSNFHLFDCVLYGTKFDHVTRQKFLRHRVMHLTVLFLRAITQYQVHRHVFHLLNSAFLDVDLAQDIEAVLLSRFNCLDDAFVFDEE